MTNHLTGPSLRQLLTNRNYWLLSFSLLVERFIYYGFRSFVIFFLIELPEQGGLGLSQSDALYMYGMFTMVAYIGALIGGILGDLLRNYTGTIMLGILVFMLGFVLLSYADVNSYTIPLFAIAFGGGIFKANIYAELALIAKQMPQFSNNLFSGNYFFISLGAALAPIAIGSISEIYGFETGLTICAAISLIPLVTIFINMKKSQSQQQVTPQIENQTEITNSISSNQVFFIIGAIMILQVIFWFSYESIAQIQLSIEQQHFDLIYIALSSVIIVVAYLIGLFVFHKLSGLSSVNIGVSFILLAITGMAINLSIDANNPIMTLYIALIAINIADLLFSILTYSVISKYSPRKILATVFGLFFVVSALTNRLYGELAAEDNLNLDYIITMGAITGVVVIIAGLINAKKTRLSD